MKLHELILLYISAGFVWIKKTLCVGVCPAAAVLNWAGSERRAEQTSCGVPLCLAPAQGLFTREWGRQRSWQGVLVTHGTRDWGLVLTED